MKKRNTVLLLGIISIIFMISVQVLILKGIWKQKDEMFLLRYGMRSQEALGYLRRNLSTIGFDSVALYLYGYSEKANQELHSITDTAELNIKKKDILAYFTYVVSHYQMLSDLLSSYFEYRGYEKNINFSIKINNLEMIAGDTIVVYRAEGFTARRPPGPNNMRQIEPDISKDKILVTWYRIENNDFRFSFDYYIDFSDKQKVILRESLVFLTMSVFSIIMVVILFMITYRNLMEERRLSNLKTDFINNMTHELKTPLSTITVAGKTLEMEQIRTNVDKILETAKLIGKQSVHLNQLINMILEISMWERTQFELDKKNVDIEEFMHDVVDSFRSGGGNGARIREKYSFNGIHADMDIIYFTTLINNLLSNAVKYSDKEPEIDIEGSVTDSNMCIRISDNGIGINKNDQKHIFDKFYRASTGNIHKFKGLGLGLYYVKKIAEAHGGDVSVSSKPGKGSIFTVTLPY